MLLIKNGYLIDPATEWEGNADIWIEGNRIKKIEHIDDFGDRASDRSNSFSQEEVEVIDAKGLIIAPGLVDVHVHFRDPGFLDKEDIFTGAAAAAKGGFTTVVLMANTKPAVDNKETLSYILEKGKQTGIHVQTCATVTLGMQGAELSPFQELLEGGAVGFTDDGVALLKEDVVREAYRQAKVFNVPLSFHEEDPHLIDNNGVNCGAASEFYGIGGSSRDAEIKMVKRDLELALEIGTRINIQHISTKEAVELVRQAKAKETGSENGRETRSESSIFAEASPHHFSLTEEAVIKRGTMAKMNPPLRTEEDRMAVIGGLQDGTIEMIATDHAPHEAWQKGRTITEAPSGIIGLETALALGIMNLVQPGFLTLAQLIAKMSYHPARFYRLDAGYLQEGGPADLILFDPVKQWKAGPFISKSQNSPFLGETMTGLVRCTICDGKIIYKSQTETLGMNESK